MAVQGRRTSRIRFRKSRLGGQANKERITLTSWPSASTRCSPSGIAPATSTQSRQSRKHPTKALAQARSILRIGDWVEGIGDGLTELKVCVKHPAGERGAHEGLPPVARVAGHDPPSAHGNGHGLRWLKAEGRSDDPQWEC
jgi:hypothetical protein